MISRIRGTLLSRDEEGVEVLTPGGVVYELDVPLSVAMRLPPLGDDIELRTVAVLREDASTLYGFLDGGERALFLRLIQTQGVGARLALAMLSTYPANRLRRALVERDVTALVQVSGVGKKTAERLVLELADRVGDLELSGAAAEDSPDGVQEAVRALMALGMAFEDADAAVRGVLEEGAPADPGDLVRKALARR